MTSLEKRTLTHAGEIRPGESATVAEVLRGDVLVVGLDDPVREVRAAMRRARTRHAVVRQGSLVTGIVSLGALSRWRRAARIRDVLRPGMVCVRADAQVWTAAALLARTGFGALPVLDRWGKLVGVVLAEDLRRRGERWS